MPEKELEIQQTLFFLTVVTYKNPPPEDVNEPVGWMPVFNSPEAARAYRPGHGQVGGFTFTHVVPQN
jgi:hypothetical protein